MVGAAGFEPATLCSQSRCATRLRHAPRVYVKARHLIRLRAARIERHRVPLSGPETVCENPRPPQAENTVTAKILDGKAVAQQIRDELKGRVARVRERLGRPPALSIVLVGDDPASQVYVRNKLKTAEEAGMGIAHERLPATATLAATLEVVRRFNEDRAVDGILVQSPLPKAMGADAEQQVFDAIDPAKDVDGFSPISAGRLVQNREGFAPCTPAA